jgi:hypothetical protein
MAIEEGKVILGEIGADDAMMGDETAHKKSSATDDKPNY